MIVPEWKKLLEGKEPFEDPDAEILAKEIMRRMEQSTNALEIIELSNDLERVLADGEWMTRKRNRLNMVKMHPKRMGHEIDLIELDKRLVRVKKKRDDCINELKNKYGIL